MILNLEVHNGITVLRDDLLEGGTKTRFLDKILDPEKKGYVYASPAYGGFQIALASVAKRLGKRAIVMVAKRKNLHPYTKKARELGANIIEVDHGYLSNVQAKARKTAEQFNYQYLEWGADYPEARRSIAETMRAITKKLGKEPDEVWCAVGSGTLFRGICTGTNKAKVKGVQVGADFEGLKPDRAEIIKYHLPFEKEAETKPPFNSTANYDAKAWEYCLKAQNQETNQHNGKTILFWNVL